MPVGDVNQLKGHGRSALHGIGISTGRAETAVAAERDEFEFSTVRAAVHGTAESGVATAYHFIHVFYDRRGCNV